MTDTNGGAQKAGGAAVHRHISTVGKEQPIVEAPLKSRYLHAQIRCGQPLRVEAQAAVPFGPEIPRPCPEILPGQSHWPGPAGFAIAGQCFPIVDHQVKIRSRPPAYGDPRHEPVAREKAFIAAERSDICAAIAELHPLETCPQSQPLRQWNPIFKGHQYHAALR